MIRSDPLKRRDAARSNSPGDSLEQIPERHLFRVL